MARKRLLIKQVSKTYVQEGMGNRTFLAVLDFLAALEFLFTGLMMAVVGLLLIADDLFKSDPVI